MWDVGGGELITRLETTLTRAVTVEVMNGVIICTGMFPKSDVYIEVISQVISETPNDTFFPISTYLTNNLFIKERATKGMCNGISTGIDC